MYLSNTEVKSHDHERSPGSRARSRLKSNAQNRGLRNADSDFDAVGYDGIAFATACLGFVVYLQYCAFADGAFSSGVCLAASGFCGIPNHFVDCNVIALGVKPRVNPSGVTGRAHRY